MTGISVALAVEVAETWETMAEMEEGCKAGRRETLRECADMVRMLAARASPIPSTGQSAQEAFFRPGMGFDGPHEADTPLQAAAREAGWALFQSIDLLPWERRQQASDICAKLAVTIDAPADQSGVIGALAEALTRISELTPGAANASDARDMHLTVKAIADTALAAHAASIGEGK